MKDVIMNFMDLEPIWRRQAIKKFGTDARLKMYVISRGKLMTWTGEGQAHRLEQV